jgi:glutamyl-tRNA synthetase
LRFKTPQRGTTVWQDGIKGAIAFENKELDDLVILRADGIPTYNFAVVVDDLTMDITQVIRGDDHIPNTPRQLVIYQALGVKPPQFAHMPLMLAKDRGKLSKRRGALPVLHYRRQGFLPHTLNNYLARLAWSHGDQEIFTPEELIRYFTLEHVGKSPGVHDEEKLLWLNGHYLKGESLPVLTGQLAPFLEDLGVINPDLGYVSRVATTLRTRSKTLVEMAAAARFYFFDPRPYDPQAAGNFLTPASAQVLKEIESGLRRLEEVSETGLTLLLQEIAANTGQKLVNLAQPLRVALTGKSASPGLAEIIAVLGKDEVLCRIDQALDFINMGAAG